MKTKIALLGVSILLIVGCTSAYLKDSSVINQTKKDYDKILVIAKTKDKTARTKFENQVVQDFAANGISATSSISKIKTDSFSKELSDEEMDNLKNELIEDGYDGVIITNLIDKQQYTDVDQGSVSTTYVPVRYGRFGRHYGYYPVSYWDDDEITTGVEYILESCLFDLSSKENNNLHWVGRFKVKDPSSLVKTIEKYSKELTSELIKTSISE